MSEPEKLRAQVRSMALLCAVFGPTLAALALFGVLAERLIAWVAEHDGAALGALGLYERVSLAFGARSAPITVALGGALLLAGLRARRDLPRGRRALELAAWFSIAIMAVYGVVWSVVVARLGGSAIAHVGGWLAHAVQALVVAGALRFLRRADVRAACEGAPINAPTTPPRS